MGKVKHIFFPNPSDPTSHRTRETNVRRSIRSLGERRHFWARICFDRPGSSTIVSLMLRAIPLFFFSFFSQNQDFGVRYRASLNRSCEEPAIVLTASHERTQRLTACKIFTSGSSWREMMLAPSFRSLHILSDKGEHSDVSPSQPSGAVFGSRG